MVNLEYQLSQIFERHNMKRVLFLSLFFIFSFHALAQTVYITNTGKKYHKESCRHLSQSKIEIDLKDAQSQGYGPCGTCKPGGSTVQSSTEKKTNLKSGSSSTTKTTGGRCQATTKKGTQCKRNAAPGSNYCWQHK